MLKRLLLLGALCSSSLVFAGTPEPLRVGMAGHAFDHLGDIGGQAETAADSGANIIYSSGLGVLGYQGLPPEPKLEKEKRTAASYNHKAKTQGIQLIIGYVCATSIVGLSTFDKNWPADFRAQFHTPVTQWRQQDRHGNPLPSWYGGNYQPACMNNPDWRAYEKEIVRLQLETGHDGIFFDNPTVHPEGCYCRFCMEKFGMFLRTNSPSDEVMGHPSLEMLRELTVVHPRAFLQFRCGIAGDFIADMRDYAHSINRHAFVTCNNSLNSPDVFFSQCRRYAYDIDELSQAEDWITVEDMGSQPRLLANGQTVEYGPTYKLLQAISHGKPVVAVTLADADYHTAPNLMRLAMAEATANGANYLSWPTWPVNVRQKMVSAIRPEADFLRDNEDLLNDTEPRCDVALLLSFQRWLDTDKCEASATAAALTRANVQFTVIQADELEALRKHNARPFILVVNRLSDLAPKEKEAVDAFESHGGRVVQTNPADWHLNLQNPSVLIEGQPNVRAVVADQRGRTIVHLYNLAVERLSSFDDKVHPANDTHVTVRVPFTRVHSVRALTADAAATSGPLEFNSQKKGKDAFVKVVIPRLEVGTILVIE